MAEGNQPRPIFDTIPSITWSTDLGTTIANSWSSFPMNVPLNIMIDAVGRHYVCGYIYGNGNYGAVIGFSTTNNNIYMVRAYNGTLTKLKFEGTVY